MSQIKDFYYDSSTGKNSIHAVMYIPDGEVRGIVQITHGISEHIGRYKEFMSRLADKGFVAVGEDHLGHGLTARNDEERGTFCEKDGWDHVVKDMVTLHDMTVNDYPGLNYILFGHSMGSFLVRTFAIDYPDKYDLLIICGTGHQGKALIGVGNLIGNLFVDTRGYVSDGKALNKLAMGNYLKRIPGPKTPFDWLTTDEEVIETYGTDPLRVGVCKAGLYRDMMTGIRYIINEKNIAKMNKDKPVIFISGADDPVGDYGVGVKKAYRCFVNAGIRDVSIKLYDGDRHEILNETNKEEVYADLFEWIEKRIE